MFLSARYRPNKWPFYILVTIEAALTVALLAFFGIAAPNLYRTRLWQDGSDNGFNSNPNAALYAAANYRSYQTPKPWSQFITDYNVVISVLSMFLALTKGIMYILHVFPPVISVVVHAILIALYSVSISYQAGSDTSDPRHLQKGAPWYITKSCSVAAHKSNIGYCQQAKAAFACTVAMLGIFLLYFCFALWSCFPSKVQRQEYNEKKEKSRLRKAARAEAWAQYEAAEAARSANGQYEIGSPPPTGRSTMAMKSPAAPAMTPRTLAFNKLGGTKDLPLRNQPSTSETTKSPDLAARIPRFNKVAHDPASKRSAAKPEAEPAQGIEAQPYFPPPPRQATR